MLCKNGNANKYSPPPLLIEISSFNDLTLCGRAGFYYYSKWFCKVCTSHTILCASSEFYLHSWSSKLGVANTKYMLNARTATVSGPVILYPWKLRVLCVKY